MLIAYPRRVISVISPAYISGLAAWYDASDEASLTLTGALVDQMNDKSGNNGHLIGTTSTRPTLDTTGDNSIVFAGDSFLQADLASTIDTAEMTLVVVADVPASAAQEYLAVVGLNTANNLFHLRVSTQHQMGSAATGSILTGSGLFDEQRAFLAAWDGDGYLAVTDNGSTGSDPNAAPSVAANRITLGQRPNGTARLNGDIHEVLIIDRAITAQERTDIFTYLASKWGNLVAP